MGEYATTTKPEEHTPRPNVRDLFSQQSENVSEEQENNTDDTADESVTRL
jgi:hypothetical protein